MCWVGHRVETFIAFDYAPLVSWFFWMAQAMIDPLDRAQRSVPSSLAFLPYFGWGIATLGFLWLWYFGAAIGSAQQTDPSDIDRLYEAQSVSEVEIEMVPDDWDQMRVQKRDFSQGILDPSAKPFSTFRGKLKLDGKSVGEVEIRKKGFFGSLDDDFPSMRVKWEESEEAEWAAPHTRLTLNNNKQDPALISQYMSYRLFRAAGVPAPRVGFARVSVNGKYLGVYSLVEPVDKGFLKRNFMNSQGDLLEGTLVDFSEKSIPRFDWKSGRDEDAAAWRVNELAKLLDSSEFSLESVGQLIDLDEFFRFWVVESLIGAWDGYSNNQNNYFVYDERERQRLVFMPWGMDSAWMNTASPFGGFGSSTSTSIYAASMLTHRLHSTPEGALRYRDTLQKVLDEQWDEEALVAEVDRVAAMLQAHLHNRQKAASASQKTMKRFIEGRKKKVQKELDKGALIIPEKAKTPMHTEAIGHVTGTLELFWERAPKGGQTRAVCEIQWDGKDESVEANQVALKKADLGPFAFGLPASSIPYEIEIKASAFEGEPLRVSLTLPLGEIEAKKDVRVTGSLVRGTANAFGGPFGNPNMKWLRGVARFDEIQQTRGGVVKGTFDVEVLEVRGGFFER